MTNPLNQLARFLSNEGLQKLRTTFSPPEGVYMVNYDEAKDMYHFCYFTHDKNEEKTGSYSFKFHLKKELTQLLDSIYAELDSRTFAIDAEKERLNLANLLQKRVGTIIDDWSKHPSAKQHPEVLHVLCDFQSRVDSMLVSYIGDVKDHYEIEKKEIVIQLPEGFKLPEMKLKAEGLNIRQTALLFHYLKEHNAVLPYEITSLSKIVSSLTGHSKQNLRAEGFGHIAYIKDGLDRNGKPKADRNKDLFVLKQLLQTITQELDKETEKNIK